MAKLKPIDFKFPAQAGEPLAFRAEVSVNDSSGEFSLTIPDALEDVAGRVQISHGRLYGAGVDRPRTHLRVTGATLDGCRKFIEHVAQDYLRCEVTEELVLVYDMNAKVAYVKDEAGQFYENGYACGAQYEKRTARWCGELNATNASSHFQIGLAARVFKKTTYTRPSGASAVYSRVESAEEKGRTWLKRLNGFAGLSMVGHDHSKLARLKQMPYTEEAAKFFFDAMMSMCRLADQLSNFFGDEQALQLAIDRQASLLPPPAQPAEPATTTPALGA